MSIRFSGLLTSDLDRLRQWYNVVADLNPDYLDRADEALFDTIRHELERRYAMSAAMALPSFGQET